MHTDAWFSFYIKKDFPRHFAERCSQKRPICISELSSLKPATLHNKDNRESTSTEYHSTGVKKFTHHLTTRITYMQFIIGTPEYC